jgi:hypothetical protein
MQLIRIPQANATMCGPEIVDDEHLAGPQEDLLFDVSQWKATFIEEGPLMLKGIELHSAEVSGRIERDQLMPLSSDVNDPAQNSFYRPVERRGLMQSPGNELAVSPGLVSQQPSERDKPRDCTRSILSRTSEQSREASDVDRHFSCERNTEIDVQSLKWSLTCFRRRNGEFANDLEVRHAMVQGIGQAGVGDNCEDVVPRLPAVLPSTRYAGETSTHQVVSDLRKQRSLQQVDTRFRDSAFAHSAVLC